MDRETHKYRVVGSEYVGNEQFEKVKTTIVAHSPEEANALAFQRYIIPRKIKDLGRITEQASTI